MSHDYSGRLYLRQLHRAAVLSDQSSTATAKAGDLKADAAASKPVAAGHRPALLPASSSPADAENFCRCSARKKPEFLVCCSCWWQAPLELRHNIRFGAQPVKRGAIRLMLEFAAGRKALRSLQTAPSHPAPKQ